MGGKVGGETKVLHNMIDDIPIKENENVAQHPSCKAFSEQSLKSCYLTLDKKKKILGIVVPWAGAKLVFTFFSCIYFWRIFSIFFVEQNSEGELNMAWYDRCFIGARKLKFNPFVLLKCGYTMVGLKIKFSLALEKSILDHFEPNYAIKNTLQFYQLFINQQFQFHGLNGQSSTL